MKILVCGSRSWKDKVKMGDRLRWLPEGAEIIHGGAPGADRLASQIARFYGFDETVFPADWERHGRQAGFLRNLEMLDQEPALVIAFWDGESRGTKHTIVEARRRNIPVEIVIE